VQELRDGLRAFNASGYEIFDDFAKTGEVVIWSRVPRAPELGDRFDIETQGVVQDLAVSSVRTFPGGWTALCRLPD